MSENAGTSRKKLEPYYRENESWKPIATMAHKEIKSVFELHEASYGALRTLVVETKGGTNKLYLAIAKQSLYLIQHMGRDEAAKVSKVADLTPDLEDIRRREMEREGRTSAATVDAFVDCGLAVVAWLAGVTTSGVLMVAAVGATAKCGISTVKAWETHQGRESLFETPTGQAAEFLATGVSMAGVVGGAVKTGTKAITSFRLAKIVIMPSIAKHYARTMRIQVAKLLFAEIPGLALTGADLLSKYPGTVSSGDLQRILNDHTDASRKPCIPYQPIFRGPAEWFRETLENGFVHVPWSTECRP